MKNFFRKKIIFAFLFTILLFLFSGWNIWKSGESYMQVLAKYKDIDSFFDISSMTAEIEAAVTDNLYGKMNFVEGYGLLQSVLGKEESNNFAFVKDNKDFLHYAAFYREDDPNIPEYAKRVRRLKEYVQSAGTKVMFIAPPGKNMYGLTEFSEGTPVNDANPAVDELLMELDKNRVDTLDLRDYLGECGLSYEELFFKTDHHWTPQAGLYAAFEIINTVEEKYGDVWDPDNYYRDINIYNTYEYPNSMVGSMGRATGINFSGAENFTLVWPEYEGDFEWFGIKQNGREFNREGTFAEAFLLKENLIKTEPYGESRYGVYLSELTAYDKIVNRDNPNGPKVLFIRDSYFSSVIPFLAPMCSEIKAYWTLNTEDKMNIDKLLEEETFDYIFIEVYPNNIEDAAFSFFKEKQIGGKALE